MRVFLRLSSYAVFIVLLIRTIISDDVYLFRFECHYNDANNIDYYSTNGGLEEYAKSIQESVIESYELTLFSTYFNNTIVDDNSSFIYDIKDFDICAVFNEEIDYNYTNNCSPFDHDIQDDDININAEYIIIAYFHIDSDSDSDLIEYIFDIIESNQFLNTFNNKINSYAFHQINNTFEAIAIEIRIVSANQIMSTESELESTSKADDHDELETTEIDSNSNQSESDYFTLELLLIGVICISGMLLIILICSVYWFKERVRLAKKSIANDNHDDAASESYRNEGSEGWAKPATRLSINKDHSSNDDDCDKSITDDCDKSLNNDSSNDKMPIAINKDDIINDKIAHARQQSDWSLM